MYYTGFGLGGQNKNFAPIEHRSSRGSVVYVVPSSILKQIAIFGSFRMQFQLVWCGSLANTKCSMVVWHSFFFSQFWALIYVSFPAVWCAFCAICPLVFPRGFCPPFMSIHQSRLFIPVAKALWAFKSVYAMFAIHYSGECLFLTRACGRAAKSIRPPFRRDYFLFIFPIFIVNKMLLMPLNGGFCARPRISIWAAGREQTWPKDKNTVNPLTKKCRKHGDYDSGFALVRFSLFCL